MKRIILSVYDKKAEMFHNPYFVPTLGVAYRDLQDTIKNGAKDGPLALHPEDFEVFQLGVFDDETGFIDTIDITRLCSVGDLVE